MSNYSYQMFGLNMYFKGCLSSAIPVALSRTKPQPRQNPQLGIFREGLHVFVQSIEAEDLTRSAGE